MMRILVLTTDAFGGHGGIALYNRDMLTALCNHPDCVKVVAVPRIMPNKPEPLPLKLDYITDGLNDKMRFIITSLNTVRRYPRFDLIICGHINLLPVAYCLRLLMKLPLLLVIYGIDAWQPTNNPLSNYLAHKIDGFISISGVTRTRFLEWAESNKTKGFLLPNAIQVENLGPGPKKSALLDRYALDGKTVLMTVGRLSQYERYKGFDEVLDLLPELVKEIPQITYMIVGDGSDRRRLEQKAASLGIAHRVIFTGFVPESEKADYYRLADVYVMPSRGEGFGFVFLEAMACGVAVIGSKVDGGREALRNGELGILVDPDSKEEIKSAIMKALKRPRGVVPEGLEYFSFSHFEKRLHKIIADVIAGNGRR